MSAVPIQVPVEPTAEMSAGRPAVSVPAADHLPPVFAPPPYPVRRFTVAEYEAIARAGILTEDDNVELLEGWIVPKMTKHPPHDSTIDVINYLLGKLLPAGWYVRIQNCTVTSDSVPEPDLAVVRGKPGNYHERHPGGADVGLIVEVADSTVIRDRRKARIYARAGVPLYWIVNLEQRQIEIYSQPTAEGANAAYQSKQVCRDDSESIALTLDGTAVGTILVRDILT
jgi:Uma2 family endonuclease